MAHFIGIVGGDLALKADAVASTVYGYLSSSVLAAGSTDSWFVDSYVVCSCSFLLTAS